MKPEAKKKIRTRQHAAATPAFGLRKKIVKLNEKKINELITDFLKYRAPQDTAPKADHKSTCMCVTCIKIKVSESKEKVIKQIKEGKERINTRDPRTSKDERNPR